MRAGKDQSAWKVMASPGPKPADQGRDSAHRKPHCRRPVGERNPSAAGSGRGRAALEGPEVGPRLFLSAALKEALAPTFAVSVCSSSRAPRAGRWRRPRAGQWVRRGARAGWRPPLPLVRLSGTAARASLKGRDGGRQAQDAACARTYGTAADLGSCSFRSSPYPGLSAT